MEARPQRVPAMEPLEESLEEAEHMYRKRGCCCFWIPTLSSSNHNPAATSSSSSPSSYSFWCRMRPSSSTSSSSDTWWRRALMKVRDWSELVAGPRWKTFIRRFNRGGHRGVGGQRRFQYDPLSYAMNFDEGGARDDDDEASEYGFRAFSTRYAAPPVSAKSSMDLGGRDAPPLFTAPAGS